MSTSEQMNINTEGLKVGSKLWNGDRGWLVVVRLEPGTVWARPVTREEADRESSPHNPANY